MGRRGDHSQDELKAMAIKAAQQIIAEDGVKALSTRKIATKMGYSVGTLYHLFKNLDEIVLKINEITLDHLYSELEGKIRHEKNFLKALQGMGLCYLEFSHKHSAEWQLLFEYPLPESYPTWYQEKINKLFGLVESTLNNNMTQPRYLLVNLSRLLWSGIHGICSLSLKGKLLSTRSESPEKLIEEFITYLLDGFITHSKVIR
jgi:AcrR family transcriptional regulator